MLGKVIRRWRLVNNVSQQDFTTRLTEAGWEIGGSRLSKIESGDDCGWPDKRIRAVAYAMDLSDKVVAFWAGRHWTDFDELPEDISAEDIERAIAAFRKELGIQDA